MKNEVEDNSWGGICVLHDEQKIQIMPGKDQNVEKRANCDVYKYNPAGTKYICRAFLYQLRGIPELESLEEGENFQIDVTF